MGIETDNDIGTDLRESFATITKENTGGQLQTDTTNKSTPDTFDAETGEPVSREIERTETGRFAPRVPAKQIPADADQTAEKQVADAPLSEKQKVTDKTAAAVDKPALGSRAPISWKPQAREKWAKVDPEVQTEILRRDREVDTALRTSAESRKAHDEFIRVTQPYAPIFLAENVSPLQAVESLLQVGAAMRMGSPQNKAQHVANIIIQHGVDPGILDSILVAHLQGRSAPQNDPVMQQIDSRLRPVTDFMAKFEKMQQQSAAQVSQNAEQSLDEFIADPANEFVRDVAADMADLLDMAANRGQALSLQDAYKRATLLHPQIADIMAQRQLHKQASQQTAEANRSQSASASLKNSGAPSQGSQDGGDVDDTRSAILASVASLSRRQ